MAPLVRIRLKPGALPSEVGDLVRETRLAIGWSQEELAERTDASQARISRVERGISSAMDLAVLDTVATALGLRMTLEVEGRHLADRADQRDPVHAAMARAVSGRLVRCGWQKATEVPAGRDTPTGWIDPLGCRERDAALAVVELKADLPDVGGLQRQASFYEREAPFAARRLGWQPAMIAVMVVCLNTATVAQRLRDHRALLAGTFPGDARVVSAWLRKAGQPAPRPSLVLTDVAPNRGLALAPSGLHGRAPVPAYRNYADAAAFLGARRPAGRRPP